MFVEPRTNVQKQGRSKIQHPQMLEDPHENTTKVDVASSLNILILIATKDPFHEDKKAQMLVSRWTLRRRIVKYGLEDGPCLEEITGFSMISDEQTTS